MLRTSNIMQAVQCSLSVAHDDKLQSSRPTISRPGIARGGVYMYVSSSHRSRDEWRLRDFWLEACVISSCQAICSRRILHVDPLLFFHISSHSSSQEIHCLILQMRPAGSAYQHRRPGGMMQVGASKQAQGGAAVWARRGCGSTTAPAAAGEEG